MRLLMFIAASALVIGLALPRVDAQQAPARAQDHKPDAASFTDADGAAVLASFARALEAHDLGRFLAVFDADHYTRFSVFAAEMDSYFGRYEQFRVHYNLRQVAEADGRGVMLAEVQLEELPVNVGEAVRRSATLRFELQRSGSSWKIVAFSPRDVLS
jgi:hypothetical protein